MHDGDSMRIQRADGAVVTIRVYGIDCPEIGQPYGKEARDLTATLLMGKTVEVTPAQKSKSYGREVASIMQPDGTRLLQEALTASGLAWVDGRYCKQEACNECEKCSRKPGRQAHLAACGLTHLRCLPGSGGACTADKKRRRWRFSVFSDSIKSMN